jgi:hypothetical protein
MKGIFNSSLHHWANVWGVLDTETHDTARANAIAAVFEQWWDVALRTLLMNDMSCTDIAVLDLADPTGVSIEYNTGLPLNGTKSGDPAGAQVAAIVTLRSDLRGRRFRGRKYFPGIPSSSINAGDGTSLDSGSADEFLNVVEWLVLAIAGTTNNGITHLSPAANIAVVSHRANVATEVTSAQARLYLGTQKRRVRT